MALLIEMVIFALLGLALIGYVRGTLDATIHELVS